MSGRNVFTNSHTLFKVKNPSSIDSKKIRDGNFPKVSEMEDTGLQDGFYIDTMFYSSTLHKYSNKE